MRASVPSAYPAWTSTADDLSAVTPLDDGENLGGDPLDRFLSNEPTPEFAAMVTEQLRRLRDALGDVALCQVLDLRLEGYTREEIAEKMGCAVSSVKRKLDMIRQTWLEYET